MKKRLVPGTAVESRRFALDGCLVMKGRKVAVLLGEVSGAEGRRQKAEVGPNAAKWTRWASGCQVIGACVRVCCRAMQSIFVHL
jgi:hypothetical protein